MDEFWKPLILVLAGLLAGIINTIAGGGSLMTLPLLIFLGLPPNAANATNRLGILFQTSIASFRFRKKGLLDVRYCSVLAVPTCLGAIAGSLLSVDLDEDLFRKIIGAVMLLMLVVIVARPEKLLQKDIIMAKKPDMDFLQIMGYFAIGFYGGFLQAGVGIFMIFSAVYLSGFGLVQANGIKVFLTLALTIPAMLIFIFNDLVHWNEAIFLAVGSFVGGYVGTHLTVSWGPVFARYVLLGVVSISACKLIFF